MLSDFQIASYQAEDGVSLGYRYIGTGTKKLLILHGGGFASQHYVTLAKALANNFTVIIPDARGRGLSKGDHWSLDLSTQRGDIRAIVNQHNIDFVFGHSRGALLAIDSVNYISWEKIAVYEPPIKVSGKWPFSVSWIPKFKNDLSNGKGMTALARYMKGMSFGQLDLIPVLLLEIILRTRLKGSDRQDALALLPTIISDLQIAEEIDLEKSCSRIQCPFLLVKGSKTPRRFTEAFDYIVPLIPKIEIKEIPRWDHGSPIFANPEQLKSILEDFFS